MAPREPEVRRTVRELLTGIHREAVRLLIELGLVADETELVELALREFIEEELTYVANEWPEDVAKRRARELLDRIAWL